MKGLKAANFRETSLLVTELSNTRLTSTGHTAQVLTLRKSIIRGTWGVYTNNGLRVVQFVNCISIEGLGVYMQVHDPYDSYDSYGS